MASLSKKGEHIRVAVYIGIKSSRFPATCTGCLVVAGAIAIAVAGCASPRERLAFDEFAPERRAASVRDDLPQLGEGSSLENYLLYAALNDDCRPHGVAVGLQVADSKTCLKTQDQRGHTWLD